tara:strand:+ start:4278 stop:5051 length:774 start_codon:yes stop_codon:yes gene_type:complete
MKFDLSGFTAPEGFPAEALENPELLAYISDIGDKQLAVHTSDHAEKMESATTAKAIAEQKIDDIQVKLNTAIAAGTGDADIDKLRSQLAKQKEESALEYRGQIDAIKAENDTLKKDGETTKQRLEQTELKHFLSSGLSEYNEKYPAVDIRAGGGAGDFLIEKSLASWKKSESGKYKAYHDDGTPMTGAEGPITRADFFAALRDKAETSFCYNQPSGGGATGGSGGGAGEKTMTRSAFSKLPPAKQSEVAKTHTFTDG